jgi:Domain of unknown function (DUF4252)
MHSLHRTRILAAAVIAAAVLASPGCLWAPELSSVRHDIERQLPDASFSKEFELSLGPVSLAFARLVTFVIPPAREARRYLRDLSRVQVAVYEHDPLSGGARDLRMPELLGSLIDDGWEMAVKVRDDEERVWVLFRAEDDAVREVFVVVLDEEQLVLVKARGRLERVLARVLREGDRDGWAWHRPS